MMRISLVVVGLLLITNACGTGTSSYNVNDINNLLIDLEDSINNDDVEAWLDCYTDVVGPNKARNEFEEFVNRGIIYDIKDISDLDINQSVANCNVTILTEMKTSGQKQTRTVHIDLERTSGGWKIIYPDFAIF